MLPEVQKLSKQSRLRCAGAAAITACEECWAGWQGTNGLLFFLYAARNARIKPGQEHLPS
jgi:hypothetical protein